MKLGSSRQRERQRKRRRFVFGLIKWGFLLGLILAAGVYAWQTASNLARREVIDLAARNEQLESDVERLQAEVTEGKAREALLEEQIPNEAETRLLEAVRRRAAEGVSFERMSEVIAAVTPTQNCDNEPTSRRFQVATGIAGNESSSASFANNTVTVRASGQPVLDAEGRPEAWYDPAKPVTVIVTHVSGATSRAEGVLPLQHAMAVGDNQFRFQFSAGARGFVTATMDRCDYP